jgi:hypothetical protein
MSRATRRRSARDEEPGREDAPVKAPDAGVADLLGLQRTAGDHAVARLSAVNMGPAVVYDSGLVKDGLNLVSLKQASEVPAKTDFVDSAGRSSGGAPPETVTGVAILVNLNASRFEDEDYMVAAIRHEMVHARLMRLTLKHLADWKQKPDAAAGERRER